MRSDAFDAHDVDAAAIRGGRPRIELQPHVSSRGSAGAAAGASSGASQEAAGGEVGGSVDAALADDGATAGATAAPITTEERESREPRPRGSTSGRIPRRRRRPPFDRGPRPLLRGVLHERSTWGFLGSGIALIVVTAVKHGVGIATWMSALYVVCLIGSMAVSAAYHLVPWRSEGAVRMWRRADHAMIAVFIAGTYGPVSVMALPPERAALLLGLCWAGTLFAVLLNVVWVNHPRWLGVGVYLLLGWLVIWEIPDLWNGLGPAITILLGVGGFIYTLGALVYALKWPNPSRRFFGFHEVFHAATIVAATLHHIAIWLAVAV